MTKRLYYDDSYLEAFTAAVLDVRGGGLEVVLDSTAFYPTSGGQPFDRGTLNGVAVVEVSEQGEGILHRLEGPWTGAAFATGAIDWARRFDHMQQHTGQHLLSAVLAERFGLHTVSFHLGSDSSTIDLATDSLSGGLLAEAELAANEEVTRNRPVTVSYEEAEAAGGLRKASEREGTLRIVSIDGLDRSACGGTHVRHTGEIGAILLRRTEKVRDTVRLEFLCGGRAVRRARQDFEALSAAARSFSRPLDDVPSLVQAQIEAMQAAERTRRKLAADLAAYRGRELYEATEPDDAGIRRHVSVEATGTLGDETRALAASFTAQTKAVFIAAVENPPVVLLAVSAGSGAHAGNLLKPLLQQHGGRGGGSATAAQGSLPGPEALREVLAALHSHRF